MASKYGGEILIAVAWDYTEHARHYDKRADYDAATVQRLLSDMDCSPDTVVADIGAGTGKLSKLLLAAGLRVRAVEPNDAMRERGVANTASLRLSGDISWSIGTGEETGLEASSVQAVFFGSSFNVVDRPKTLKEAARILKPNGRFCCMWNHRVLDDPIQQQIEQAVKNHVESYSYGSRREDPSGDIVASGLFDDLRSYEGEFVDQMATEDVIEAWRSHATLRKQVKDESVFDHVVSEIATVLENAAREHGGKVAVPYVTRAWTAGLVVG